MTTLDGQNVDGGPNHTAHHNALEIPQVRYVTAGTTLLIADSASVVEVDSAAAVNVTAPSLQAGVVIEVCQVGVGAITIVAGSGVTLRAVSGLASRGQWASIGLRYRTATEVVVDA